jgi:hypothetical protein
MKCLQANNVEEDELKPLLWLRPDTYSKDSYRGRSIICLLGCHHIWFPNDNSVAPHSDKDTTKSTRRPVRLSFPDHSNGQVAMEYFPALTRSGFYTFLASECVDDHQTLRNLLHTLCRGVYDSQIHPSVDNMTYNITTEMGKRRNKSYQLGLDTAGEEKGSSRESSDNKSSNKDGSS